jgi:hypothetical protein
MMIVGNISTKDEALEIETITKNFLVGRKARLLASQL